MESPATSQVRQSFWKVLTRMTLLGLTTFTQKPRRRSVSQFLAWPLKMVISHMMGSLNWMNTLWQEWTKCHSGGLRSYFHRLCQQVTASERAISLATRSGEAYKKLSKSVIKSLRNDLFEHHTSSHLEPIPRPTKKIGTAQMIRFTRDVSLKVRLASFGRIFVICKNRWRWLFWIQREQGDRVVLLEAVLPSPTVLFLSESTESVLTQPWLT